MEILWFENLEGLERDLFYLGVSLLLVGSAMAAHNLATPEDPVRVGLVEVETRCVGFEAGICLGLDRRSHETFNYDDWENPEPGTENFYRLVEAELMAKAYNVCSENVTGMEWTSMVEYRNKTGEEWRQNQNVELLPCEKTFYRELAS